MEALAKVQRIDWRLPVSVDPQPNMTQWQRAQLFFGHCDIRVYLTPKAYLDVGGGSMTAARYLTHIPEGFSGSLGSVGRCCEFAGCEILFAGEHRNDQPVNIGFKSSFPMLGQQMMASNGFGLAEGAQVSIGNAVVVSSGATILSGATVGDGAVIGAGAVVSRPVAPYAIVGGVPAREIRKRFDVQTAAEIADRRWWDWEPAALLERAETLQNDAIALTLPARPQRPRFVFHMETADKPKLVGLASGEDIIGLGAAPASVQRYAAQALGDGPHYWVADSWTD